MKKGVALAMSLLVLLVFSACAKELTKEEESKAAVEQAMKFVRAKLPNPESAVFASKKNMEIGRFKFDPHRWKISSTVSVDNEKGKKTQYEYDVMVRYSDMFGDFSLVDAKITEIKKKKKKKLDTGMK